MTVLARIEAVSPGAKPRASSPSPISRTAAAVRAQVHSRQRPSSFCRMKTRSARCAAAFQNTAVTVSPGMTMPSRGCS